MIVEPGPVTSTQTKAAPWTPATTERLTTMASWSRMARWLSSTEWQLLAEIGGTQRPFQTRPGLGAPPCPPRHRRAWQISRGRAPNAPHANHLGGPTRVEGHLRRDTEPLPGCGGHLSA